MTNAPFAGVFDFRDIESINHYRAATAQDRDEESVLAALRYKSRDNARTPMQWDASPHAGFTTGEPWIPANPNHVEINAAEQVDDPDSVFHHYRRLIELRHQEPCVAHGDFTMLVPEHEELYAFTRTLDDVRLTVVANLSLKDGLVPSDEGVSVSGEVVLTNESSNVAPDDPLGPWAARVLRSPS